MLGQSRDEMMADAWYAQWRERFPAFAGCDSDTSRLRLVLGVGRSGTTWLSRVLAATTMPIRYVQEGFFRVEPKLEFATEGDHTAIAYRPQLNETHPLLCVYHAVATPMCDCTAFGWERSGGSKRPGKAGLASQSGISRWIGPEESRPGWSRLP